MNTATNKYVAGTCREGNTGTKVHAATKVMVASDKIGYNGWETKYVFADCLGPQERGFRLSKFHGFVASDQRNVQVTCKNCLAIAEK